MESPGASRASAGMLWRAGARRGLAERPDSDARCHAAVKLSMRSGTVASIQSSNPSLTVKLCRVKTAKSLLKSENRQDESCSPKYQLHFMLNDQDLIPNGS